MESNIERHWQAVIEDDVLEDAYRQHADEKAEEDPAVPVEMINEINAIITTDLGKDHRGKHVQQYHLQQDDREGEEVPMRPLPETEARPPRLRREKQDQSAPDQHRSRQAHASACEKDCPIPLKHLRDRE